MATTSLAFNHAHHPDYEIAQPGPCRFCGAPLTKSFIDLGAQPPSNAYLHPVDLRKMEPFYPLHAWLCTSCFLVQLEQFQTPHEMFSDYAYFSSFSNSWLKHAEAYCHAMIERFGLGKGHRIVEIASNDGYLLQFFTARGIPVLGVEPAANVARVAEAKGIPTRVGFFGRATARELVEDGYAADLLTANNVLAHVPDLNDFVAGFRILLKQDGIITIEFPHLLRLIAETQFDTIYHEHFSYFSFTAARRIFATHGIRLFDVETLPTHGGSLRIFGCHEDAPYATGGRVADMAAAEAETGIDDVASYDGFADRVQRIKRQLLSFLIDASEAGKSVAAYGAAAKGNTLLNYCGIGPDMIDYVADASPHKQGMFLPGSHIPVVAPAEIARTRPDYLLILPWNLKAEIIEANAYIRDWGGRFVVPIPELKVVV